jgi:hypothetical protein
MALSLTKTQRNGLLFAFVGVFAFSISRGFLYLAALYQVGS